MICTSNVCDLCGWYQLSVSKPLRLDFSDEMETLKVELKKAGKLDDAPKVGTCWNVELWNQTVRKTFEQSWISSRFAIVQTDIRWYSDIVTLKWLKMIAVEYSSLFIEEIWRNHEHHFLSTMQGIAQKDPAAKLDPRGQAINSAPWQWKIPWSGTYILSWLSWSLVNTTPLYLGVIISICVVIVHLRTRLCIG